MCYNKVIRWEQSEGQGRHPLPISWHNLSRHATENEALNQRAGDVNCEYWQH